MNLNDTIKCECCNADKQLSKLIKVTNVGVFCLECIDTDIYNLPREEQLKRLQLRKDAEYVSRKTALKKYGITPEDYDEMYSKQEGKCAICKSHQLSLKKKLCVDHCHKTGKVRGLLCNNCNLGLGSFKDDKIILETAIKYLI